MGIGFRRFYGTPILAAAFLNGQAVLTWHNDNARTGQNLYETVLTPANVNAATFGLRTTLKVDGKVDAQPLYVPSVAIPNQGIHDVLYVATEHGSLYAFDADTFALLRQVSLLGAGETPSDDHGCGQVTPEIGITATPAIDLDAGAGGTIYVVAQSKDASQHYYHRLHALDLTTLTEQLGGPVESQASFPGKGAENIFDPAVHVERPGLVISNGVVYTSWGSHCDAGSYAGWVLSYSETTLAQVGVLNLIPNGNDGGIWAAGSGPAIDANGNLFLMTGNGTFDTTLNASGFPSKGDFGNAFVRIAGPGSLSVADYFTMLNTVPESAGDVDLGSGGLMLLPPLDDGSGGTVSLVVGAGKDTNIYILNQTNLGKFNPGKDSIYQQMSGALPGGSWASPAWFNGKLYYGGVGDELKAFAFSGGLFTLASHSANTFVYPGTTPSISANGILNGIVWAVENQGQAILHAYDANNVSTELYNSTQAAGGRDQFGAGNKFITPTIASGKVFVGTTNGVGVFGLLSGNQTPTIGIRVTHPGNFTQGQMYTASYTITVTSASAAAPVAGPVTVTELLPAGLELIAMSGSGWTCSNISCSRSDPLTPGGSYPPISVAASVATNAPLQVVNEVTVSAGGFSAEASDATAIVPASAGSVTLNSVQNAASYASGGIAPGEIVYLSGSGMGPAQLAQFQVDSSGDIPAQLAGTEVLFNGIAAPLIDVQSGSVGAIVPYEVTGSVVSVVVQYQAQQSSPVIVPLASSAPGLFTALATGTGQAAAINQDGSYNSAANPAKVGSIISLYATGEGQTSPAGIDGKPAAAPLPAPILAVSVTIGGITVNHLPYAGGAPGDVAGLMQINVPIPLGVAPAAAVPVTISVGSAVSQAGVTIAVAGN